MTDYKIKFSIGCLPPRTKVTIGGPVTDYECIDCGFKTNSLEAMLEHQKNFKHSLWKRIRRSLI